MSNQFDGTCVSVEAAEGAGADDSKALSAAARTRRFDLSERVDGCNAQTASKT